MPISIPPSLSHTISVRKAVGEKDDWAPGVGCSGERTRLKGKSLTENWSQFQGWLGTKPGLGKQVKQEVSAFSPQVTKERILMSSDLKLQGKVKEATAESLFFSSDPCSLC